MIDLQTASTAFVAPPIIFGDRVRTIRTALKLAKPENSRIVAATIGGHLEVISRATSPQPGVVDASAAVRDASFDFLVSLVTKGEAGESRSVALHSVDRLEAMLCAA